LGWLGAWGCGGGMGVGGLGLGKVMEDTRSSKKKMPLQGIIPAQHLSLCLLGKEGKGYKGTSLRIVEGIIKERYPHEKKLWGMKAY